MAEDTTRENNSTTKNSSTNEINAAGKLFAGFLLIALTAFAITCVIAYWPNKMPPITQGDDGAWYTRECFNVTLIEKNCVQIKSETDSLNKVKTFQEQSVKGLKGKLDSATAKKDSLQIKKITDSLHQFDSTLIQLKQEIKISADVKKIHLNTILLLLVALMGFLGNMVHIATSFTTYVGNETFKKSWILWYFVKPFTASGLAIIVYFIIRAGFLSYGTGASGVSLYGILSLSALAGLFTDNATLKLKEIFDVIFKPKDERNGKLQGDELAVTAFSPETIKAGIETNIVLIGKNLNLADFKITIDGNAVIPHTKTTDKMEIKYTPTIGVSKAVLAILDKAGRSLYTKEIIIN